MMKSWFLTTCTSSKNGTLNYLIVLTKVPKGTPSETFLFDKITFFRFYAELLMLCRGDIELNPGPEMCYEYFFKVSEEYKNNLRFVHLNIQDLSKKQ